MKGPTFSLADANQGMGMAFVPPYAQLSIVLVVV